MSRSWPEQLTDHVTVFGNGHFRHYLVGEYQEVLIECGVTASARHFVKQLSDSGRPAPDNLLVMHAHFDHVCGIPELKRHFPGAEVLASPAAAGVMDNPKVVAGFFDQDRQIAGDLETEAPGADAEQPPRQNRIAVDRTVSGGDRIALKGGGNLELIAAPGHSPCGLAAWFEKDRVLFVSDALGFQISDEMIFPVFFHAYRPYIETIEQLAKYPADVLAFPHERIWQGKDVKAVFLRALSAARDVREEVVSEVGKGQDLSDLKQILFNRFYRGNLRIYTPENIRLCVDLLVRRSIEDR
ncbi:MBL fold metallo-hydrolase [uncultured Desulfosarcina sp.]|uniref:MBL fold metallo-hydrolase n=1 Tax=uncultured Desulfosarcina sp. TaxID=218289 RepID=UPI0029C6ED17|nr:MBL fold metallo-hydrolase [uncultured Desulfosarcina sp.]